MSQAHSTFQPERVGPTRYLAQAGIITSPWAVKHDIFSTSGVEGGEGGTGSVGLSCGGPFPVAPGCVALLCAAKLDSGVLTTALMGRDKGSKRVRSAPACGQHQATPAFLAAKHALKGNGGCFR